MTLQATTENPRAVSGDNQAPEYARQITEQMRRDYEALSLSVAALLLRASTTIPETVEDDEQLKAVTTMVVDMRDAAVRAVAFHKKEKEPFLRGGQAVDSYFFDLRDKLEKAIKVVGGRGDEYNQRKVAAERAERQRIAREAEDQARRKQEEADRVAREAEEARKAAERARKPERVEQLATAAEEKSKEADKTQVESQMAGVDADAAREAARASAAELGRQRFDTGRMTTMKQAPHVEITDASLLPLERLRPYIQEEALLRAVKAYAKMTNYRTQMPGATIEMRDATVYR